MAVACRERRTRRRSSRLSIRRWAAARRDGARGASRPHAGPEHLKAQGAPDRLRRSSAMPPSPTRHRVAVVLALVGVAVSVLTFYVTRQLASVDGYTSFCNLGGVINCDTVLSSRWGRFLGLPVPLWAIAVFALGVLLALPGASGAATVGFADLALIALASGSLGFALVLAGVSAFKLHAACLLCITLYVVIIAWFITVVPLARRFQASERTPLLERRTSAHAAAEAGLLVAVAAGSVEALRELASVETVADVKAADPKFFDLYSKLSIVNKADVVGFVIYVKGNSDAPVTIVEFSDFECPACGHAFGDLRELVRSRPDVKLVFRHYPLDSTCNDRVQQQLHPDACRAAAAAECARSEERRVGKGCRCGWRSGAR